MLAPRSTSILITCSNLESTCKQMMSVNHSFSLLPSTFTDFHMLHTKMTGAPHLLVQHFPCDGGGVHQVQPGAMLDEGQRGIRQPNKSVVLDHVQQPCRLASVKPW